MSGHTALWLSGGKDSRLLLEVMKRDALSFIVLCFDDTFTRVQKRMVERLAREFDLEIFSYPPTAFSFVSDDKEIAAVFHYAVGRKGETLAGIRDIVHDREAGRCMQKDFKVGFAASPLPPVFVENHILGSKRSDRHFIFGNRSPVKEREFSIGEAKFFAPLFDWTDEDVYNALGELGVNPFPVTDETDTGNFFACSLCLTEKEEFICPQTKEKIQPVQWDGRGNLEAWRKANNVSI